MAMPFFLASVIITTAIIGIIFHQEQDTNETSRDVGISSAEVVYNNRSTSPIGDVDNCIPL